MNSQLRAPVIVSTPAALRELAQRLQDEPLIAVDTESNSLFAYQEQVCLIQFSTPNKDWVVDPLALPDPQDLNVLAPIFASSEIEKIFHAAEYDLMCMKRDFGFTFVNLFDTMISARIIGRKTIGLANLLEDYFGLSVDKRFQRADWSVRPIPAEQLQYAQQDTHYLPALRDIILEEIKQKECLTEAREVFAQLANVPAATHNFDPDGYWKINAAHDFSRRQMAVLREVYLLREEIAKRRNRPPFKVFTDEVLVNLVRANPHHLGHLSGISGMSRYQIERFGHTLLQAIQQGHHSEMPVRPDRAPRADPATLARYDALREWRKARAAERGVESDVIIPKDVLWALAQTPPRLVGELDTIPGFGPWKREKYGEELVQLLARVAEQGT
jgi:ribonuclease D